MTAQRSKQFLVARYANNFNREKNEKKLKKRKQFLDCIVIAQAFVSRFGMHVGGQKPLRGG